MVNRKYLTGNLANFYATNRTNWAQFYESERHIISRTEPSLNSSVLDVGCGCGGLGLALRSQFGTTDYTGIDINMSAIETAKSLNKNALFLCGDLLDINLTKQFSLVFSLSCIDWNVDFLSMLHKAWSFVSDSGYLVVSLRLTQLPSLLDPSVSYQYINFEGLHHGEVAPYYVINISESIEYLKDLGAISSIYGYGYYGKPSSSAITPYSEVCFTVFALRKNLGFSGDPILELDIPISYRP